MIEGILSYVREHFASAFIGGFAVVLVQLIVYGLKRIAGHASTEKEKRISDLEIKNSVFESQIADLKVKNIDVEKKLFDCLERYNQRYGYEQTIAKYEHDERRGIYTHRETKKPFCPTCLLEKINQIESPLYKEGGHSNFYCSYKTREHIF